MAGIGHGWSLREAIAFYQRHGRMPAPLAGGATDDLIARGNAAALIPEELLAEIFQEAPKQSNVMRLARRLPDMQRDQLRLKVLDTFPQSYWLEGDTALIQSTNMAWVNKYINAEGIASIVTIPKRVLMSADNDLWAEVRPRLLESIGATIDETVLFGTNAPASFPTDVLAGAVAASQTVTHSNTGDPDLYDEILSENGVFSKVEEDGFPVTGTIAAIKMRAMYRGLRDANGNPIFLSNAQDAVQYTMAGVPVLFPDNGGFDETQALQISGDWRQLVWSLRRDVEFEVTSEAPITDNQGKVIINTFQQNVVALKVTMYLGWQLPNPVNRVNQNDATRYPFSALLPA